MKSPQLCMNKVASQHELSQIIKFYYKEYQAEEDVINSTKIIHELFIFIYLNMDIVLDKSLIDLIKRKANQLVSESEFIKSINPTLYNDFSKTLNKFILL